MAPKKVGTNEAKKGGASRGGTPAGTPRAGADGGGGGGKKPLATNPLGGAPKKSKADAAEKGTKDAAAAPSRVICAFGCSLVPFSYSHILHI